MTSATIRRLLPLAAGAASLALLLAPAACGRKIITEDAVSYESRGDQNYEKGDYDESLKNYNRALELGSQKLKIYNNIGNIHFRRGKYDLAEKYYRMALEIDSAYLFSLNNLALTLARQGRHDEAAALLSEALTHSTGSALINNTLSQILLRRGDVAGAVKRLQEAVAINPDYAIALNNLGDIFLKHRELGEDPLPLIMRAVEKEPDNPLFYDTLGWYYTQLGVFDEALVSLGKALVGDPENLEIRVHYATVLEWLGKTKEALEQWEAITEMPGDKELIVEARRRYWEIKGR